MRVSFYGWNQKQLELTQIGNPHDIFFQNLNTIIYLLCKSVPFIYNNG